MFPGMPPPQPYVPAPASQPAAPVKKEAAAPPKKKPKDFAEMMGEFEKVSLDKKEEKKRQEEAAEAEQYDDAYGDEYGSYYDPMTGQPLNSAPMMQPGQNMFGNMQQAPNALAGMLSQLANNA